MRTTPENAARVQAVCVAFGFHGPPFLAEEFEKKGQTFQLGRAPNRVDLLTSISGVNTEEAWSARVRGKLSGKEVYYISREHLIINKQSTGRLKDKADAEILIRRKV